MTVLIPCNAKGAFSAIARAMVDVACSKVSRRYYLYQANFVCPGGIYRLGRQQKLLREGSPNHLDQFTRQLEGHDQPQARQRHPEACHIRGHAQVAMQSHLAAPASASPCTIAMVG